MVKYMIYSRLGAELCLFKKQVTQNTSKIGRTKVLLDFSFFTMHLGKRNESNWAMLGSVEA